MVFLIAIHPSFWYNPAMLTQIFVLLLVYQLKHFLADYPLQGKYMLGKFKPGWDFLGPLLAHVGVHGVSTLVICLVVNPLLWWLSLVDLAAHFTMDRIKASPKYLGRYKALSGGEFKEIQARIEQLEGYSSKVPYSSGMTVNETYKYRKLIAEEIHDEKLKFKHNTYFWWSLGLDQMVHHLTHYYIIYTLVTYGTSS